MPPPSPQGLPILFLFLLHRLFISALIEPSLAFFKHPSLILPRRLLVSRKLTGLELTEHCFATIFPQNYCAFIICRGEHGAQVVPADTVYGA